MLGKSFCTFNFPEERQKQDKFFLIDFHLIKHTLANVEQIHRMKFIQRLDLIKAIFENKLAVAVRVMVAFLVLHVVTLFMLLNVFS